MTFSQGMVWVTYLGQTIFENLNPFWAFCEKQGNPLDQLILFHPKENPLPAARAIDSLAAISKQYSNGGKTQFTPIAFDDENVREFCSKIKTTFHRYCHHRTRIIVDVSPTSWSFVPTYLMRMARENRSFIQEVIYFQYVDHASRKVPYPLIARQDIIRHNLLDEFEKLEVKTVAG